MIWAYNGATSSFVKHQSDSKFVMKLNYAPQGGYNLTTDPSLITGSTDSWLEVPENDRKE